jgi:hypothetical protein
VTAQVRVVPADRIGEARKTECGAGKVLIRFAVRIIRVYRRQIAFFYTC